MKNINWRLASNHLILLIGVIFMSLPVWVAFSTSTHTAETILREGLQFWPGSNFIETYREVMFEEAGVMKSVLGITMLKNSLILGIGFAVGKVIISMLAAYAIVYFRFKLATPLFWIIFLTLLLPLEVRIIPSYEIVAGLGLLDTNFGLIVPLIASATGTFYFRQFFKSIPDELLEAARLDGASPWRFFVDMLIPLSKTMIAAILIIMFVVGWNQYLWPLLITTDSDMTTIVVSIKSMLEAAEQQPEWNIIMMTALLAMIPPVFVVIAMQKLFVKGLTETDK